MTDANIFLACAWVLMAPSWSPRMRQLMAITCIVLALLYAAKSGASV
jgi:hypothetical protein